MLEKFSAFLDRLSALPRWQIVLLVLLACAAASVGYFVLRPPSRPAGDFQAADAGTAGERAEEKPQELTVHVAGAVNHPGVVLLAQGDRVIDAIEAAGGPLPEADLEALNLALTVQDGQKIAVPSKGAGGAAASPAAEETADKINLNTADQDELEKLPGIGPTLAERIIAYREKKGGFGSTDELKQVSGIGDKKFEEIRDLVEI